MQWQNVATRQCKHVPTGCTLTSVFSWPLLVAAGQSAQLDLSLGTLHGRTLHCVHCFQEQSAPHLRGLWAHGDVAAHHLWDMRRMVYEMTQDRLFIVFLYGFTHRRAVSRGLSQLWAEMKTTHFHDFLYYM